MLKTIYFISFQFISFHFNLFHFISINFISFQFIPFHFNLHHFISIYFHFNLFYFISIYFISFYSIPFHFIFYFIFIHFLQNWQRFLCDGLHFSKEGHELVVRHLMPVLQPKIDALPIQMPIWKDIDFKNLTDTFNEYNNE